MSHKNTLLNCLDIRLLIDCSLARPAWLVLVKSLCCQPPLNCGTTVRFKRSILLYCLRLLFKLSKFMLSFLKLPLNKRNKFEEEIISTYIVVPFQVFLGMNVFLVDNDNQTQFFCHFCVLNVNLLSDTVGIDSIENVLSDFW